MVLSLINYPERKKEISKDIEGLKKGGEPFVEGYISHGTCAGARVFPVSGGLELYEGEKKRTEKAGEPTKTKGSKVDR